MFTYPDFNILEFEYIRNESRSQSFTISVSQWVERTNSIGIISSAGRYGGTYAHKDIAFEFATWLSAEFKYWIITEFQRLKEQEQKHLAWSAKRELAKVNYHLQTNAIAENLILPELTDKQKLYVYTDNADMLNVVLFGRTAKQWREENPDKDHSQVNIRDSANLHQLLVLANMESLNATMIDDKIQQKERMEKLRKTMAKQLQVLAEVDNRLLLKDDD